MTTYARVQNNTVLDVIDFDPWSRFHSSIANLYTVVPDGTLSNAQLIDDEWVNPIIPVLTPEQLEAVQAEREAQYMEANNAEQAASVRSKRNKALAASDWTQLDDAPVDQAAWATYRQELRDISAQAGFPATVEWPTQPE